MERARGRGLVVGLLVCLPVVMLGAMPAVGWQLPGGLPFGDATSQPDSVDAHSRIQRGKRVKITGTVQTVLSPGVSSPILVSFKKSNKRKVRIRRVRVTIVRVIAPRAVAAHPCSVADFQVRQMRRGVLRLPAKRRTDLARLGVPVAGWPQLAMRNLPVNQDGCKDAQLMLKFRARRVRR